MTIHLYVVIVSIIIVSQSSGALHMTLTLWYLYICMLELHLQRNEPSVQHGFMIIISHATLAGCVLQGRFSSIGRVRAAVAQPVISVIQWNLRIMDKLGTGILSIIQRLSLRRRFHHQVP